MQLNGPDKNNLQYRYGDTQLNTAQLNMAQLNMAYGVSNWVRSTSATLNIV